ncbi:hypothetical protein ACHQM5_005440 [Ranunculus cassubicifolius]
MNPVAVLLTLLALLPIIFLIIKTRKSSNRLPPGNLGLPFIGQSFEFLNAMRANTADKWIEDRVKRYGAMSKLSLLGSPTVLLAGEAANKLLFTSAKINSQRPKSSQMLLGKHNLLELEGEDHKRVRRALMKFLKPDALKQYVNNMDEEVRKHLEMYWQGKEKVTVLPLMKTLTFDIICSLLFGLEPGFRRKKLVHWLERLLGGLMSIPINLPFTRFNCSIRARRNIETMIVDIIHEKRLALEKQQISPQQDLITSLISDTYGEDNSKLSEMEIIDNIIFVMVAGHDTSATLLTLMIRLLANDPTIYTLVLKEHEVISKRKSPGEILTWDDICQMNYTWKVALETLRIIPVAFGGFKKTSTDLEYGGYLIPKGWQVLWASNLTHMNEGIFPEPSKFDPERFEDQMQIPPYSFVGFGAGKRICPGYEFAKIETLVAIHYLVTRFTWKLCIKDDKISRDPMPIPSEGLPIKVEQKIIA